MKRSGSQEKSTQINSSFKYIPDKTKKCSVGSQKDLDSISSILCGKRSRICMVKEKKTFLSPLANQVQMRSQLWGKITRLQSLNLRELKSKSKFQGLLISEHVKNNKELRADIASTKRQFKRLKKNHTSTEMELALKTALSQRDHAITLRKEAEMLLEKKKIEFEEMKKEMKNIVKEQKD